MSDVVLQCKGLAVDVPGKRLLDGIDAVLTRGSITAVLGPNGAGKSTLLKALVGLQEGVTGSVFLEGREVDAWSRPEIACRLAYLPQYRPLSVPLAVRDLVAMGRYPHLGSWRRPGSADQLAIQAAMDRLEISHLAHRDACTLSGGELQRAFLARCLAQGSPLLVLDEPLTGLDIGHQLQLLALLEGLAQEGRTILWSVHDLRLASEHARDAWLLDQGRLVGHGSVAEVLGSPQAAKAFGVRMEIGPDGSWRFLLP
ncbi:MAG: ABC transporter ATP-binding protein [Fibrobacteria bacterium]|nr:ABC transporter ATP-binding protein [Fibrobacteria bacterium]